MFKNWVLSRAGAEEFYFKRQFNERAEYSILIFMLSISLFPMELGVLFLYTYFVHPIRQSLVLALLYLCISFGINFVISKLIFKHYKREKFVERIHHEYKELDENQRKKFYSFKSVTGVFFSFILFPWAVYIVATEVIIWAFPH